MPYKNPSKIILFILFFFSALLLGCETTADPKKVKAPDFTLEDISGEKVALSQYLGKVVILDFWATWCPSCKISIPELVKLQEKYMEKGLVTLGISVDNPDINNKYLSSFKEKHKINYPILRADDNIIRKYFSSRDIIIPTLFIINREGMVIDMHSGYRQGALEKSLENILK